MSVSSLLLLLLVFSAYDGGMGAKKQEAEASLEGPGARLRGLWLLHIRDSLQKGKESKPLTTRTGMKQQLLYCRVGIGYHLQIMANGAVGGVHKPNDNCWLRVFAMKHGVVVIRGVKSGLFLCMGRDGLAYGAERFSDDCQLKENLEENLYTTYSSLAHPGVYLALSHKGELKKGNTVGRHQACTHFLPRRTL
ncbi:fibroblast growth factor 4A isoform X2 [Antennarius striatus]|uniref:fibroblast growth factor 4A isoform X2 n=1 Tax=Antennarius striatus TaxID=241820 RepID=UPI0035B41D3E